MTTFTGKRAVLAFLVGALIALGFVVLRPFLIPVAWASIIGYVTWPIHERMRSVMGQRHSLEALLMTAIFGLGLVIPMLLLVMPLAGETMEFYRAAAAWIADEHRELPQALTSTPWLGTWLQRLLDEATREPSAWRAQLSQWSNDWIGEAAQFAGSLGRNAVKFCFAVVTLFFVYRDGETILKQVRQVLTPYLGGRLDVYLASIGDVCRSVVLGIVLTAAAQGVLAGIGYWAAGVDSPLLLALLTALVALLPFGTPFVWAPVGVFLLINGHAWAGIGLLLWGALAVSWIDNLIRPLVISSSSHIPFLLVVFGILGGIMAFGLIGLFIGPFVMATLLAAWREWVATPVASGRKSPAGSRDRKALPDSSKERQTDVSGRTHL